MNSTNHSDVIVIGGGPGGTTASTLIAQRGFSVTLLERELTPQYRVGESLIPETYWTFKRLKMLDILKSSHFVKKHGVQFVNSSGQLSAPFYFHEHKPGECSQTWQIRRIEFDSMMIQNAREQGVAVNQGIRVLDILFNGDRAVGVLVKDADGNRKELFADVIVDASGQSSMIINKFKLREPDPSLNKGAIWTYYEGAFRDEGKNEGATIVLSLKNSNGWFWYIPLHDDIVSVGVVADFDYLFKGRQDHETTFHEELQNCPVVKKRIATGKQVATMRATKDFTYRTKQAAGNGWVLVGDALGFLDPLYSSGILLALKSGELAADAIIDGLNRNDTSEKQLGIWAKEYFEGMDRMRRLVVEFYNGFNFGDFVRRFPHHKGNITDLLIGDLFKADLDQVFLDIDQMKSEEKSTANKH
ncbi:NAD(P)/FAD-dependent oxidoreductase [Gimesia algae]|uniref:Oxidoreductase n=1 Tax=Gimesia algae TaxID=2527971 RepID=A0A517V9Z8_9PLAN|nr:NAD(P)/FAD-dependent oxidoreductase [Gimesia algae]QDT89840.1 Putative oxidoreductase [Gimesia algae]